jgi:peptidase M28-like protein
MRRVRIAAALMLGAVAVVSAVELARAQRGRGGQGEALPLRAHSNDVESSYLRMPLPPAEQKYAALDGARMKQVVEDFAAISRKSRDEGNKYWGRIAGAKADLDAEEYVARRFREFGLEDVHMQPFDLPPQWFALDWSVAASSGGQTIAFKTAFPSVRSPATPPSGLDLDIVWVGNGGELDFAGRDVKGKAVFIQSFPTPSAFSHTAGSAGAMQRAVAQGAAAVIINIAIPGSVVNETGGAEGLPSFAIGSEEAAQLRSLMARGPVRVRLTLRTEMRSGLKDNNVWGTVRGNGPTAGEEVIVFAHHDGYFESAFDNASGNGTMLGMAEYFAKIPRAQRTRTIKFVSTAAHHAGSPGTRWMYENRDTAMAQSVLFINCEHTSITQAYLQGNALRRSNAINARRWFVHGSDRLASIALNAYKTFGVSVFEGMEPSASGDMGQIQRERPAIQLITSPIYYHSEHDRPVDVPAAGLEAVARAYAKIIDEANKLSRAELEDRGPTTARR